MKNEIIGGCSKHIGQSWLNCPMCAMEEYKNNPPKIKVITKKGNSKLSKAVTDVLNNLNKKNNDKG